MPLEDLELEFEDEDETKKKKDALHVDVDLEFSTDQSVTSSPSVIKPAAPAAVPTNAPAAAPRAAGTNSKIQAPGNKPAQQQPMAKVTQLPQRPVAKAAPMSTSNKTNPQVQGSMALADQVFAEDVNEEVLELREKVQKLEIESQVKVGIAEFKADFLSDVLSDMKLMDHQVTQILSRINAKHPDSKNEVMMIKKLLTEFAAKKRK